MVKRKAHSKQSEGRVTFLNVQFTTALIDFTSLASSQYTSCFDATRATRDGPVIVADVKATKLVDLYEIASQISFLVAYERFDILGQTPPTGPNGKKDLRNRYWRATGSRLKIWDEEGRDTGQEEEKSNDDSEEDAE
ncbi:hypothetical protein N7474_011088 [Penicillium riverlandense]|uniref:uncharacterized protein n=1 Tax=Penicillium riverlandense TaxID=1903569 RepID=UPI002548CC0B|nr:uncharacterized protein N7474_011088 [Penicillium riverlandense]KAJ5805201.1 hypothetical protein N7474_011088 [Penicillium riverlandense]